MTSYNEELTKEYGIISAKVKRGMLPLVARNPAIDKATQAYSEAQSKHHETLRATPISFGEDYALERFADLVMHEELTWSHADKMSLVEYPIMSDNQEKLRRGKYTPNSDLQYGDRRFEGRRKTSFMDKYGSPQVRNPRVANPSDPVIDEVGEYDELYEALDNAGLTERQSEAIELLYYGNEGTGMEAKDVALVMGITRQAVELYAKNATRKLYEYMTKN